MNDSSKAVHRDKKPWVSGMESMDYRALILCRDAGTKTYRLHVPGVGCSIGATVGFVGPLSFIAPTGIDGRWGSTGMWLAPDP